MENHSGNHAEDMSIVAEARAAVADRLITPWWYHPILGALLAGFMIALSLGNTVVWLAASAVFALATAQLTRAYRRLTGIWIEGDVTGLPKIWIRVFSLTLLVLMTSSWAIGYYTDLGWLVVALAALTFVVVVVFGRRYDEALRAHLREG